LVEFFLDRRPGRVPAVRLDHEGMLTRRQPLSRRRRRALRRLAVPAVLWVVLGWTIAQSQL
jgi:hypothetical protein